LSTETRELYASPNGDRWYLAQQGTSQQVYIQHIANAASGGHMTRIEVGEFLVRGGNAPEQQALLRLIGTLTEGLFDAEQDLAQGLVERADSLRTPLEGILQGEMDIMPEQQRIIVEWAEGVRHISEVRLFGSRAQGRSRPESDIDPALTIGADRSGSPLAIYLALGDTWQADLTARLGLPAHVCWSDMEYAPPVYESCQKASVLIYSRNA
jgi:hypothetical protein